MDAAGLDPDQGLQFGNDRPQSVAVKGIAVQRLGVQHELPAFRPDFNSATEKERRVQ